MNAERRKRLEAVVEELSAIRDEEQEAFDATPESIQQGERGQSSEEAINTICEVIHELESIE